MTPPAGWADCGDARLSRSGVWASGALSCTEAFRRASIAIDAGEHARTDLRQGLTVEDMFCRWQDQVESQTARIGCSTPLGVFVRGFTDITRPEPRVLAKTVGIHGVTGRRAAYCRRTRFRGITVSQLQHGFSCSKAIRVLRRFRLRPFRGERRRVGAVECSVSMGSADSDVWSWRGTLTVLGWCTSSYPLGEATQSFVMTRRAIGSERHRPR